MNDWWMLTDYPIDEIEAEDARRQSERPHLGAGRFVATLLIGSLLFALALVLLCVVSPAARGEILTAQVRRVVDGDTIIVGMVGERETRVRIANIAAPELPGDCREELVRAYAAKGRLSEIVRRRHVLLRIDARRPRDSHGRILARVFIQGHDVGEMLIREGYALPWEGRQPQWC